MDMLGESAETEKYSKAAADMAEIWNATAKNPDGTTNLAFDRPYTYSMKYNMVWDKVWGTNIFSQEFRDFEIKDNLTRFNEYGMPLDNRTDYTKSDWLVWTASMASDRATFEAFVAPLWKAYRPQSSPPQGLPPPQQMQIQASPCLHSRYKAHRDSLHKTHHLRQHYPLYSLREA